MTGNKTLLQTELRLEMDKIKSIVKHYARRGAAACMRAAILREVERGFKGDYEELVRKYRDTRANWFAEGR